MKTLIFIFILMASSLFATEGVFYVNKSIISHQIAQSGMTITNKLIAGSTSIIESTTLTELLPLEKTTVYLSGGFIIEADNNSVFSINAFDQEVKNLTNSPSLAIFGPHNINIMLSKGNFIISYKSKNEDSICTISTPLAMYQLNEGEFLFQISNEKSLVYVLDGMMIVHGDKNRADSAKKGSKSITGQIDTDVATTTRPINVEENNSIIAATENKTLEDIRFIIIDGKVRGVKMSP
ncbi:MAG TPA: hypothetical protein PLC59_00080 [Bacteroidales bacterium]|nr:hypothetical protein [Bacteroidales bacterium]